MEICTHGHVTRDQTETYFLIIFSIQELESLPICLVFVVYFNFFIMESRNEYLEFLKCLICYRNMSNNIKLCVMGHSVCCECFNHLGLCPYCRSPWSRSRNYNMEQLTAVSSENNRTKDLINNENLKCPKCRSLMDGSIVLCGGGHSYCTRCVKGIYQCIICSKLICYRRNFTLEKFINHVKTLNESTGSLAKVQALLLKSLEMFLWFVGLFSLLKYTMYLAH